MFCGIVVQSLCAVTATMVISNAIYFNAVNIYGQNKQLVINRPVLAHTCGSYAESLGFVMSLFV